MERTMSRMWARVFFALISGALIINSGYASDSERDFANETTPPKKYTSSPGIPICNNQAPGAVIIPLKKNHRRSEKLEAMVQREKIKLQEEGIQAIQKYMDTCFDHAYSVCESKRQLRLYLWGINHFATEGKTEKETEKNYLTAAKHLKKITSTLDILDKLTILKDLPEFQVEIKPSNEESLIEVGLNEKIYDKICDWLKMRFLATLPKNSILSDTNTFIENFLRKEENIIPYDAIKHVYARKITELLHNCISDHQYKNTGELDFADGFL